MLENGLVFCLNGDHYCGNVANKLASVTTRPPLYFERMKFKAYMKDFKQKLNNYKHCLKVGVQVKKRSDETLRY